MFLLPELVEGVKTSRNSTLRQAQGILFQEFRNSQPFGDSGGKNKKPPEETGATKKLRRSSLTLSSEGRGSGEGSFGSA